MARHDVPGLFETGLVLFPDHAVRAADRPWYAHPAWDGVLLKDLATGTETGGAFSYHLVRVRARAGVPDHAHEAQWEWNAVLGGAGTFVIGGAGVPAGPGQTFSTPPGHRHAVAAGDGDLSFIALFVPALA